jgi:hypothetical protein
MNTISLINPLSDSSWDAFVVDHPFGWITHLSGWKKLLEESFANMSGHYLVLRDDSSDAITAALPVFKVESWLKRDRLVSIPFATICDPLVSTHEEMKVLLTMLADLKNSLGISNVEIRTHASASLLEDAGFSRDMEYKNHFIILDREPEQLKQTFHRRAIKKRIAQAVSSRLVSRLGESESDLRAFYRLHLMTRKRLGFPPQPYSFFENLWQIFAPSGRLALLLAERDKQILGGLMLLKFKNRVSAEVLASDVSFRSMHTDIFLYWEAIKIAFHEGYKIFDFGRTSISNVSLMLFKNRWGTTTVDLPQFFCPVEASDTKSIHARYQSSRLLRQLLRVMPIKASERIGNLYYNHFT